MPSQTYTLETPTSHSNQNTSRHKNSSKNSITYASQSKTYQSTRPEQQNKEIAEQEPDLSSSEANNTIYECLQLLTNNELSFVEEDPYSFHSLLSDEEKKTLRRRHTSSKLRTEDKKEPIEKVIMTSERFRARSIGVVNLASSSKLAGSASKRDLAKQSSGLTKTMDAKRKEQHGLKSNEKEKKTSKSDLAGKSKTTEQKASEQKVFLKESIYKISRASSHNYEIESPLMSASVTARKLERDRLSYSKGHETVNLATRVATSPLTERESSRITNSKTCQMKSPTRGISPSAAKEKVNKSKTETSNPFLKDGYHTTKSSESMTPMGNSLNQSGHRRQKGPTMSVSKHLQNSITLRSDYSIQKSENQKPLESIKETAKKLSEKKEVGKCDSKVKKDFKTMKATKIDLVEVNLTRKSVRKMKEEKMEECLEKIEEMYEKLKKSVAEKRDTASQNDNFLNALEHIKSSLNDACGMLKN